MSNATFPIVLVDDDEDDRMIINEAFVQLGYQPDLKKFITGQSLLDYLAKVDSSTLPSLIVLDNTLHELNALDMLSILKSKPEYKSIPVIVYTSALSPSKKEKLLEKGALACIEKGSSAKAVLSFAKDLKVIAGSERGQASKDGQQV
jgi:CheY-like chemotaxis protein